MDAVGTRIPASPWNPGLANGGLCVRGRAGLLHEARLRLRLMPSPSADPVVWARSEARELKLDQGRQF